MCPQSRCATRFVWDIPTCSSEKCPQCPLGLLEQNFLRSGCSTQIAGSCKVYAGERLIGKQVESCTLSSKKWGALMKHSGRRLLFEQHFLVRKHVTLSQKMHLVLLVSIPAPCFFDQEAVHDKNSKGDIRGFPNWEDSQKSHFFFLCERCKKTPHHCHVCRGQFQWEVLACLTEFLCWYIS